MDPLLLAFATLAAPSFAAPSRQRPRIVLFSPNSAGNTYWQQLYTIADAVRRSLDFDFVHYDAGVNDRFAKRRAIIAELSARPQPDVAAVPVLIGIAKPVLEAAAAVHVPVILMGPLFPAELPALGKGPRDLFQSWIGLASQDEVDKGYQLADTLLSAAEKAGAYAKDGKLHAIALGGNDTWFGSQLRADGLQRAIKQHPRAVLKQLVPTTWTQQDGTELTTKMLKRFPEASVVWAASDQLAIGAVAAVVAAKRVPGKTAFIGGLDLSDNGLRHVKSGDLVATVGPPPLLSFAQVLICAYDFTRGFDFAADLGTDLKVANEVVTKANVDRYLQLSSEVGKMDFTRLSKAYNPKLQHYDFSLKAFTNTIKN